VIRRPIMARPGAPLNQSALRETKVAPSTMIPAFCMPMKAMKRPIPTPIALFRFAGMLLTMASRMFAAVRIRKMIPSTNTAVSANCQLYPMPNTTV